MAHPGWCAVIQTNVIIIIIYIFNDPSQWFLMVFSFLFVSKNRMFVHRYIAVIHEEKLYG